MSDDLHSVAARFAISRHVDSCDVFRGGHIHDSYLIASSDGQQVSRYLMQRMNTTVFQLPHEVISNIQRVIEHVANVLRSRGEDELDRRVLSLVPTRDGQQYLQTATGESWRMYRYVERTEVYLEAETPRLAFEAARAFGVLQDLLNDLPGPPLFATIPDFHNTPLRFTRFEQSIRDDACDRVAAARAEIDFVLSRKTLAGVLATLEASGQLPVRNVHNDAKISNVLFDQSSHDVLCVVDLDTVMPGLSLHDFGDMVRSMATRAGEEEVDLTQVEIDLEMFEALASGFLEATQRFLTPCERQHLLTAGQVITFEQSVRFLTDFIQGDPYYKTQHPRHNLERCRNQNRLLESIEQQADRMQECIKGG